MRWKTTLGIAGLCLGLTVMPLRAQFQPSSQVPTNMLSALKPPAGARVAIIEFADLECPSCAHENPLLKEAAEKYHVPWIRHDFPLPQHTWSFQAAVNARWFDTKSPKLGNDYRDAVFANQINIENPDELRTFTENFAKSHGIAMPFVLDPQNKLAQSVRADKDLGISMGVHQTPTIWVVTNRSNGPGVPYVQVDDPTKLYTYLDQAIAATSRN